MSFIAQSVIHLPHNRRRFVAISAIAISILAAIALANASGQGQSEWVTLHPLAPGATIHSSDIAQVDATLGSSSKGYYPASARIVGNVVTRPIGQSEFIPLNALTQSGVASDYRELPIGIGRNDLPADLSAGDRVDLYSIPKEATQAPQLVATSIHVQSVDSRSKDFGGTVGVLFLLHERDIPNVMNSISTGRIVVVRNAL